MLIRPWRSKHSITCLGKKQFRVSSNALYLTDRLPHHHFRCHLLANNAMAAIAAKTAPARNVAGGPSEFQREPAMTLANSSAPPLKYPEAPFRKVPQERYLLQASTASLV